MDDVEEIKKRIDIVDLIGGYVPLKKAGLNHKGLCPFHKEDTPSFMVSPEKQIWHCFGCGEGGDIFTFIQKMEGLEFPDALKLLADKAGIKLKHVNQKVGREKTKLSDINEVAANFYHQVLLHPKAGKRALAYLKKRGIKPQTIKDFQIGYAPNNWEAVFNALTKKKNFKAEDVERAGLAIRSTRQSSNPYYDRFRERIMFPIRNIAGTCVGFSGRTLEKNPKSAKYINTPETPIFNKSQVIFGLDRARNTIREKKFVIVVEGQMDVVTAHQAGFKFMVATSGTALTVSHIETLKKYTENIGFCFDTDQAGTTAAKRAINVANQAGVNVKLIVLPAGEDPDSLIKKDKKKFITVVKNAKNAMDFYMNSAFADKKEFAIEDKREITKELLPQIRKIADPVIRGEYMQKLASKLGTDEKYLEEAMEKLPQEREFGSKENTSIAKPYKESLEERVIAELISFPKITNIFIKKLNLTDFASSEPKKIYSQIKKLYNKTKEFDSEKIIKKLPADLKKRFNILLLKVEEDFSDLSDKEIFQEIGLSVNRLKSIKSSQIKKEFEDKIRSAEQAGDRKKVKALVKQFQNQLLKSN